jgi:phage terminase small subunit
MSLPEHPHETPTPVRLVEAPVVPAELPPAPAHLSEAMRRWWDTVNRDFVFDEHHCRLLEAACDSWDRMVEARDVVREEGLTKGGRRHPAVTIELESRIQFARLLRELDLDAEPPKEAPRWRPPPIKSNRRR